MLLLVTFQKFQARKCLLGEYDDDEIVVVEKKIVEGGKELHQLMIDGIKRMTSCKG